MYAIMLAENGRIGYVTYPKYATNDPVPEEDGEEFIPETLIDGYVLVDRLPEGDIADYRYVDGEYVHDPLPVSQPQPTEFDLIEAQVTYTAMMTDTLLEV